MVQGPLKQTDSRGHSAWAALTVFAGFLAALLVLPLAVQADVFTVEDVAVDATAANAAQARERAIVAGQQKALERLFARLTPDDQRAALPRPSANDVSDLVRDFAVENEKTSAVRYIAALTVRFRSDDIRALLRAAGVSFAETMSKPMVVVPMIASDSGVSLWDEMNPWLQAWQGNERHGLVPFVVPLGDLADVVALDAARAQAGEAEGVAALAGRYQAGNVLVMTAQPLQQVEAGVLSLQITTARFNAAGGLEGTDVRSLAAAGARPEAQWHHATAIMAADIEDSWKRTNLIRFDSERSLIANAPLAALGDLLDLRKRLDGVSFLRSYELIYLARDAAQLRLHFFGDENQLSIALAQSDLSLAQDAAQWVLQRAAPPPRGSSPNRLPQQQQ